MIFPEPHRSVNAGLRSIAARRLIGLATVFIAATSMSACYAFVPTTTAVIPEATPVTVSLTLAGTVALQSTLGQGVNEIEGKVVRSNADTLIIEVENSYTTGRQKFASSGTTASLPRPHIETVKVRTFSRRRTVLAILGGAVVAIGAAASVAAGGGNGNGGGVVIIQP